MSHLAEKYRPQTFDDLVGQSKIVNRIKFMRDRGGLRGRVFWLVGNSGSGKTSAARIIANDIADSWAIQELDAQEFTLDAVRQFERMCSSKPIGEKGCHVFICNESHRLSDRVVSRLQTVLEEPCVQRNSTWIFTTTIAGQTSLFADKFDACPFLSRATVLEFESRGEQLVLDYACHVRKIAQAEGCDGQPIDRYIDLIKTCKLNLRQALMAVESGCMLS
ncbi:AAA family ATPase [Anatilimnocola floriformis]|uniref:AAA family ATPase n=1 Tax=Anatilimnocola floriformis TaxID=2948575 RepID=UPI0020C2FEAC|nr:AAA family ATPase [Anatilimnocola floriformis]